MEIPIRVAKGDGVEANRRIIAMKYLACVFASLLLCGALSAQMVDTEAKSAPQPGAKKPVVLMTGIGNLHHPVSTKNAEAYYDAMREVAKKFPDDLDAATLFAEAGMNLHPWGLWHLDGTPEVGTEEIVATLESVIKRDPNHMGAAHYYIHAVEASNSPEHALAAANRLAALAPSAGHIVHMPA